MNPFEIIPSYVITGVDDPTPFDLFTKMMQKIVDAVIPAQLKEEAAQCSKHRPEIYARFIQMLPILTHSSLNPNMNVLSVTLICPSQYTHGMGRYLTETLIQCLIPGHPLNIISTLGINFQFKRHHSAKFYVAQRGVAIMTTEEFAQIQQNLGTLMTNMRINMLSVYRTQYLSSLRGLATSKKFVLPDIPIPANQPDRDLYRHIGDEERLSQITQNITHLLHTRPQIFDRDVFHEMNTITHLFGGAFGLARDPKHLGRIVAYQYLFKKIIQEKTQKAAQERHLTVKVLRTFLGEKKQVLAVLIGMNLVKESERFEIRNLLEAIRTSLPDVSYVEDSMIADRRHEKIRFFYLEVEKQMAFSHEEIKRLKQQLPLELTRQIENMTHPIFMPRNEEELMRNLINLSKQLKYVRDLPQISIHYEKQTDTELFFTILLVRLITKEHPTFYQILKKTPIALKIDVDDLRNMGVLKQKYTKEAAVLRVCTEKAFFFRLDHSVDLLKARQKISQELNRLLGEFRDFNGGMILKQEEALQQLKQLIGRISEHQGLLLENYFYSLRPGTMPTIFEPQLLKHHFDLLCESLLLGKRMTRSAGDFLLSFIYPVSSEQKEEVFQAIGRLQLPSYSLTHASLQTEKGLAIGFIFRASTPEFKQSFEEALSECEYSALHH